MRLHSAALAATLATSSPLLALAAAVQLPFDSSAPLAATLQQPDSTPPVDYPYRQLPWGEVNVLATTDTCVPPLSSLPRRPQEDLTG